MKPFSLGANYWSRHGGPRMWTEWDQEAVRTEIEWARQIGLDTLRFFLYWPDFEPRPGVDGEEVWERVAAFAAMCDERGLKTFPTLLVGHMSGRNWDPPWRDGRDLWTDTWMVEREESFIGRSVARLQAMPSVAGWVLTNEWPLYAGITTPSIFQAWVKRMVAAVREQDPLRRPISLGDGLWNALGSDNGIQVNLLEREVDIVGPHVYPESENAVDVAMAAYVHCAMAQGSRPVLLEEFGTTDAFGPRERQAEFYRSQLAGALMAGAKGAWSWCLTDFNLTTAMPYSHHPFELRFGLITTDGIPKATAKVMGSFASLAESFGTVEPDPIGIVIPALQTGIIPFARGPEGELMTRVASRMLRSLAQLGYNPQVIREPIPPEQGYTQEVPPLEKLERCRALFLVAPRIGEPLRERLWEWVRAGGSLYIAYSHTYWFPDMAALLGVEREGLYNVVEHKESLIRYHGVVDASLGDAAGVPFISLRERGAQVLAHLDSGEPALFRWPLGQGAIYVNALGVEASPTLLPGLNSFFESYLNHIGIWPRIQLQGSVGQAAVSTQNNVFVMNHGEGILNVTPRTGMLRDQDGSARERIKVSSHHWWMGRWDS